MADGERALVEQAQRGDHDAFVTLVARYDRQIMSVVYRFSCDQFDREDLYQEVFLHSFRALPSFRSESSFLTWLYRVALNRCATYVRGRTPTRSLHAADAERSTAPTVDFERRFKLLAVHRALNRLRGPQQLCFHLFYIEGWGVDRVAETLGISVGTVKSHLHRAREKIRSDDEVLRWRNEAVTQQ